MANQWFRMYSEFASDPKVQRLSEAYQRRFVMLLCLRCRDDYVTSRIRHSDEDVAFALRISDDEWLKTKALFIEKGLIDDSNEPLNWDKRQFPSDSSAARTREYRKRKKEAKKDAVTSQVTMRDALETETETETEKEEKKNKQKEKSAKPPDKKKILELFGISGQLATDFIEHRKSKRAPITETVMQAYAREAVKAGISTAEAVAISIERNWQGFKADWHQSPKNNVVPMGGRAGRYVMTTEDIYADF